MTSPTISSNKSTSLTDVTSNAHVHTCADKPTITLNGHDSTGVKQESTWNKGGVMAPNTHWWTPWPEWSQRRWRGTGSLPGCWSTERTKPPLIKARSSIPLTKRCDWGRIIYKEYRSKSTSAISISHIENISESAHLVSISHSRGKLCWCIGLYLIWDHCYWGEIWDTECTQAVFTE